MKSVRVRVVLAIVYAAVAVFTATGCGPGDSGEIDVGPYPNNGSGTVAFAIKDAPLSSLQTLTIDISKAKLLGAAGTSNYQVFPLGSATGVVTVDLLSLQGFSQLLSTASVPAGTYHTLEIDFGNPQAKDFSGVPQNITSQTTFMHGVFSPPLSVTAGSLQSVIIDVDLQGSYHDLGGNNGFLTPVVQLDVISGSNPPNSQPLRRFFGAVISTDPQADTFVVDTTYFPNIGIPMVLGQVTTECDPNTVFNDGMGGISTGSVASKVNVRDFVEIEGVLAAGVIDASTVTLIPLNSNPVGSPPTLFYNHLSGTILEHNPQQSTVTIRVENACGSGNLPSPGTDKTLNITALTSIHQGGKVLTQLVPGNFCYAMYDPANDNAIDIDETSSVICGDVVSATAGGGAGGADRIVFTPATVNQIPVAQLSFVQSPLTVDIPAGTIPLPTVGSSFCVVAFFDGTSTLDLGGMGGVVGAPGGGSNVRHYVSGTLSSGSTATVNALNSVQFSLDGFDPVTLQPTTYAVTVTTSAVASLFAGITVTNLTTPQQVADAVNNNAGAYLECVGNAGSAGGVFVADLELNIFPQVPTPGATPGNDVIVGWITNTATQTTAGGIKFTMDGSPNLLTAIMPFDVTVPATAVIEKHSAGGVQTLTVAQAIAELNTSPAPFITVEGTIAGLTIDAHVKLTISR